MKITTDKATATIKDGVIPSSHGGNRSCELKKVERASPTLNARPPAGAVVLFDGTTAEHFEDGKLTDDGLLMPA